MIAGTLAIALPLRKRKRVQRTALQPFVIQAPVTIPRSSRLWPFPRDSHLHLHLHLKSTEHTPPRIFEITPAALLRGKELQDRRTEHDIYLLVAVLELPSDFRKSKLYFSAHDLGKPNSFDKLRQLNKNMEVLLCIVDVCGL